MRAGALPNCVDDVASNVIAKKNAPRHWRFVRRLISRARAHILATRDTANGMDEKQPETERDEETTAVTSRFNMASESDARAVVPLERVEQSWKTRARLKTLLIIAPVFLALGALVWYLSVGYWTQPVTPLAPPDQVETLPPAPTATIETTPTIEPTATPTPSPAPDVTPAPQTSSSPLAPPVALGEPGRLLIPVAGIRPEQLSDTYNDARSEGRVHNAIDIIAPRGAPVLAAADGRIARLFQSEKGGITIYQLSADEKLVYYYAHLERYADGLKDGHYARRGEIIGYVGDTGNATPGNYHLHFQVYRITDPKRFWDGENLNPYTLLR